MCARPYAETRLLSEWALDTNMIAAVEKLAESGMMVKDMYHTLGITGVTWYKYIRIGKKLALAGEIEEGIDEHHARLCQAFYEAIERGRTVLFMDSVEIIRQASKKDWKAAAYIVEHMFPEWNKAKRSEHSGEVKIVVSRGDDGNS